MNTIITAAVLSFLAMFFSMMFASDSEDARKVFKISATLFVIFCLWLSTYL